MPQFSVSLDKVVEKLRLEVGYTPTELKNIPIYTADVNRPGLLLTGYDEYFDPTRIQIFGNAEVGYLTTLPESERRSHIHTLFAAKPPALIVTRNLSVFDEVLEFASQYEVPVLRSTENTSSLMSALISNLSVEVAPRITRHGVFVEIYGEGILILGESGVGKSETAVELVKRGHRLIADDAVEIKRNVTDRLVGTAPELIRHYIELRGIGIINARRIFGMGAVKVTEKIDMVIQLEQWDNDKVYDRMGLDNEYADILGIKVPMLTIPVKPGRNLAIIIEVASMNSRQKKMGYNAAQELMHNLGMTDEVETPPSVQIEWNKY